MEEHAQNDTVSVDTEGAIEEHNVPGIIAALGELQPSAIVTEEGVARLFNRHIVSVKRAVERGELPPPCRLFGAKVWTVGSLIRYIEQRLDRAAQQAERETQRMQHLSPLPEHRRRL